ncbi:hypothetical protein FJY90_03285 [Candidatus Gottesmanbacteria bacterium]|nr:hypothetical protein [Candidatus Gottesmanbacteria bacterium]
MTSSKLMLIFLAFIFVIIVVLSSRQIGGALRARFGKYLPPLSPFSQEELTITPSPSLIITEPTSTPELTATPIGIYEGSQRSGSTQQIPATGPENFVWLILGGSFLAGVSLKKITG